MAAADLQGRQIRAVGGLAKVDRERQEKVLEYAKKLGRNPEKVRAAEQKTCDEEWRH